MTTANPRQRRTRKQMIRSPLSRTNGTTGSRIEAKPRVKVSHNATTVTIPDQETTGTGMENIVSTVRSRTIPKKNAGKESGKTSKTNKDVPTGQKCM
jgi:hypothetical protein